MGAPAPSAVWIISYCLLERVCAEGSPLRWVACGAEGTARQIDLNSGVAGR
jgi:hypothetical protein